MSAAAHDAITLTTIVVLCLLLIWLANHKAPWL